MADRFEQLKLKYQSVLNFIQSNGIQLQNVNMEGDKLFIRATAPSADLKNRVWDQIKLVDPEFLAISPPTFKPRQRPQPQQQAALLPLPRRAPTPFRPATAFPKSASSSTATPTST